MGCPRCSFPDSHSNCELCGLSDFDSFEITRLEKPARDSFEFTLIFPDSKPFPPPHRICPTYTKIKKTSEALPRYFIFFPDHSDHHLIPFLQAIQPYSGWQLLINGHIRPYAQELWLPLMEILHLG